MEQNALSRHFLDWFNAQSGKHFACEKTSERFPDAAFEYVLVESDVKESWQALEGDVLLINDE